MQFFDRLQSADDFLNRLQDRLKSVINPIAALPLLNGHLTDETTITTSFKNVEHKLGRQYQGWIVTQIDGDGRVYEDLTEGAANNPDKSKFVRLRSAAGTLKCRFWVF